MTRKKDLGYKTAAIALAVAVVLSSAGVIAYMADDGQSDEASAGIWDDIGDWYQRGLDKFFYKNIENLEDDLYLLGWNGPDDTTDDTVASDDNTVKAAMRVVAMTYTAADIGTWANSVSVLVDNNAQILAFNEAYVDRVAEIAAGSLWTSDGTYDAEDVLYEAAVYSMIAGGQYNTDYGLWYAVNEMADRVADQWAGSDTYGSIQQEIAWSGDSSGASGLSSDSVMVYFTSIVSASTTGSSDSNRVYYCDDKEGDWVQPIIAFQDSCTMTADDGTVYNLSAGSNDPAALGIGEGWYTLSTGTYAGFFQPSPSSSTASVSGGAVIVSGSDYGRITVESDGSISLTFGGTTYTNVSWFGYHYSDGTNEAYSDSSASSQFANLLVKYSAQSAAYQALIASANSAAMVMWMMCDAANSANLLISPSSVSTMLADYDMDVNQAFAVAVTALSQISEYYTTYGTQLTAAETKISAESLELYCLGDVYDSDGDVLYENVIFTPYTYNSTMTVYGNSDVTTWPTGGIVMLWHTGSDISDISDFSASDTTSYSILLMPKGSYMVCDQVMYEGNVVSSVTLHATEVQKSAELSSILLDNTEAPAVLSAETLILIVLLEAAAIVAVIGLWTKRPVILIIAAVIAVCATLFIDPISSFLLERYGE